MDANTKQKLDELELGIQTVRNRMEDAINNCNCDYDESRIFIEKKLQCEAELRLIKHIKSGFVDEFVIC